MKATNPSTRCKLIVGILFLVLFAAWTAAIISYDVQPLGAEGTMIGFATWNTAFHDLTGVHRAVYDVTDVLGLVPFGVCGLFGIIGLVQWIQRKNILNVDWDILALGCYYIVVILCFFLFEKLALNYRPVKIEGKLEASYPSSTTMLVLCVMPVAMMQTVRRVKNRGVSCAVNTVNVLFTAFMVIGRLLSGVHWLTDILGGMIMAVGMILVYAALLDMTWGKRGTKDGI